MRINGSDYRTIWLNSDGRRVHVIDQTVLPHRFETKTLANCEDAAAAISAMTVRGAPLIGVTGAYGMALAAWRDPSDAAVASAYAALLATRPTAVNLRWALDRLRALLLAAPVSVRADLAYAEAAKIATRISRPAKPSASPAQLAHQARRPTGRSTFSPIATPAGSPRSTAAPPRRRSIRRRCRRPVHVWVDETRPRNQGASLTAWELLSTACPTPSIADNAGGHLMQHGLVDLVIVGTDRTTRHRRRVQQDRHLSQGARGARQRRAVLCRAAVFDHRLDHRDGLRDIPIEERDAREVTHIRAEAADGATFDVSSPPTGSPARQFRLRRDAGAPASPA